MAKAFFPGSFDPVTNGHVKIARRATEIFENLVVGVYTAPNRNHFFSADERVTMLREALADLPNTEVIAYSDLTVNVAKKLQATVLLRGLRIGSDFEYEREMALTNRVLDKSIDTIFLMSSAEYQLISSSRTKEIAHLGGDISSMVPQNVYKMLTERLK